MIWGKKATLILFLANRHIELHRFKLTDEEVIIGRSSRSSSDIEGDFEERKRIMAQKVDNRIDILKSNMSNMISKNHCTLRWDPSLKRYKITNQGINGTFLNHHLIEGEEVLQDHSMFAISAKEPLFNIVIFY